MLDAALQKFQLIINLDDPATRDRTTVLLAHFLGVRPSQLLAQAGESSRREGDRRHSKDEQASRKERWQMTEDDIAEISNRSRCDTRLLALANGRINRMVELAAAGVPLLGNLDGEREADLLSREVC